LGALDRKEERDEVGLEVFIFDGKHNSWTRIELHRTTSEREPVRHERIDGICHEMQM
jgi:hypothetical protein